MPLKRKWSAVRSCIGAIVALSVVQSACRDDAPPRADNPSFANTSAAPGTVGIDLQGPPGVDGDDDPKSPRALPRTGEIQDWVKTRPVRMVSPDKAALLIEDEAVLKALGAFQIESLAGCRYNLSTTSAEVLYAQTGAPADAFGLVSVLTPEPGQFQATDRSFRAIHIGNAAMRMAAQQGSVFILIDVSGRIDLEHVRRASRRLMDQIIFNLPAADPPLLLQLVPEAQRASTRMWLTRDMNLLARANDPLLHGLRLAAINRLLGLGGDGFLSVVAVPPAENAPAYLLWLAEYCTPSAAQAAYNRCLASTQDTTSGELNLVVLPPKANRVAGAWTSRSSPLPPMLKALADVLPK